jgi:hypothetical protein
MNKEKVTPQKETLNYDLNREVAIQEAIEKGLNVVYPKNNELLLDIDTEEQIDLFEERFEYIQKYFDCTYEVKNSQSGYPHCHIYVTFDENTKLNELERIFLQLFLGSDPIRELLSYLRWNNGDVSPTLLLEKDD